MKFSDYFKIVKTKKGLIVKTKIELLKQQKKLLIENGKRKTN